MSNTDTTIKSQGPLQVAEDEVTAARAEYLKTYDAYVEQPTVVNRNAMYKAYENLSRARAQYTEGRRLLIEVALKKQVRS